MKTKPDERLKRYAMNQQPMDLDRAMPPTSKKRFMLYLLASPVLALGAWLVLIWACLNADAN